MTDYGYYYKGKINRYKRLTPAEMQIPVDHPRRVRRYIVHERTGRKKLTNINLRDAEKILLLRAIWVFLAKPHTSI